MYLKVYHFMKNSDNNVGNHNGVVINIKRRIIMLGITNNLYFPKLVYLETVTLNHPESPREISVFKLDWSKMDEILKKKHFEWKEKYWPKENIPYIEPLPEIYEKIISNLLFALDRNYLNEIHRCCRRANEEWNISRPFDTVIRDMCLEPAISCVYVAFKLLADCTFDNETKYFSRDYDLRFIVPHLMGYRFWCHQTGRGMIMEHSKIDKLTSGLPFYKKQLADKINEMVFELKKHNEELDKAYEPIMQPLKGTNQNTEFSQ